VSASITDLPDPRALARSVLAAHWNEGILPVDPSAIGRKMGAVVFEAQLPQNISGALLKEVDQPTKIIVNVSDKRVRKRFTCAHEIAHLELRKREGSFEFVDYRENGHRRNKEEHFADKFASELLMPTELLREALTKTDSIHELAKLFDVSEHAMAIRVGEFIPPDESLGSLLRIDDEAPF
jgi:Zn-dependent peptidase ImmA (M78 family)